MSVEKLEFSYFMALQVIYFMMKIFELLNRISMFNKK